MKEQHLQTRRNPAVPANPAARATERPLEICVVFEDDASARSAEVLIRHAASDFQCDTQLFAFGELDPPGLGVAAE